jgi:hypothetical protein
MWRIAKVTPRMRACPNSILLLLQLSGGPLFPLYSFTPDLSTIGQLPYATVHARAAVRALSIVE